MTFHIRDIVAMYKGEYVVYLDGKQVFNIDEILRSSHKVDSISVENGLIRFDISKMQFTAPNSNDEFAKEYKAKTGEDVSFF